MINYSDCLLSEVEQAAKKLHSSRDADSFKMLRSLMFGMDYGFCRLPVLKSSARNDYALSKKTKRVAARTCN